MNLEDVSSEKPPCRACTNISVCATIARSNFQKCQMLRSFFKAVFQQRISSILVLITSPLQLVHTGGKNDLTACVIVQLQQNKAV